MRLRKNMKRTAAAALALSMAVSAAMPASAGYKVDMSQVKGDVTVKKETDNTVTVTVTTEDGKECTYSEDETPDGVTYDKDDDSEVTISGGKGITTESKTEETTPVTQESTEKKGVVSGGRVVTSSMNTGLPGFVGNGAVVTSTTVVRGGMVRSSVQSRKSTDEDVATYESKDETPIEKAAAAFENAIKYVVKIINNSSENLDVTLDNVNIEARRGEAAVSVAGSGDTTIELDGSNELKGGTSHAALEHNKTKDSGSLTIQDKDKNGSLTATAGSGSAGIGGSYGQDGEVTITGGTINAAGNNGGAGIGGGKIDTSSYVGGNGTVKITGGKITASSDGLGAGIGGGYGGDGTVEIIDGDIIAESVNDGAGIGGGATMIVSSSEGYGGTGNVTISGGTVDAESGYYGAGIGGGVYGDGKVTISGSAVIKNAKSGSFGAGIGGGGAGNGNVTIEGNAKIEDASAGIYGAGIGGGYFGDGTVTIKDNAEIDTATGGAGNSGGGAGIGGGRGGTGTVTVEGGANVTAKGGTSVNGNGAAIGDGAQGEGVGGKEKANLSGLNDGTITRLDSTTTAPENHEHHWKETGRTKATCEANGSIEYECDECGATKTEGIKATGHHYVDTVVEPTCTEGGYTVHTCDKCSDTYTDSKTEATGHHYVDTIVEPTCTEGGYTTHTCDKCGDSYTDSKTEAAGHHYVDTVVEPTCTEQGYTLHTCVKGDHEYKDNYTDATGHHYVDTVVDPTCTEGGYTTHTCDKCGDTYTDNETKALGHDMTGEWEVVREATYDEPGEEITYCQNGCGHSETRKIPQLVRDDSDNAVTIDTAISVVNGSGTDILRDAAQVQLVQVGDVLYIEAASQDTAAVEGVLNDLSQLVENGVQTIVFTTSGRTSTIHLAEAVALGSSETPFTLSHNGADASLTVGGVDHSGLIH